MTRDPADELHRLEQEGLLREPATFEAPVEARNRSPEGDVLRLASNAYLGLNTHPDVVAAAQKAAQKRGTGAGASPLVSGHTDEHARLEARLAELKRKPAALAFASGYHANVGTITALAGTDDLVLSDELNHASIVDGCQMSNANVRVYDHASVDDLAAQLDAHRNGHERCLIVTDGVFSMDGELAPLPEIAQLAREHDAMLMVDDAHGTGVLGENGAGTSEHFGLDADAVDVQMGTLSKALASQGGFVATTEPMRELLVNRARPYVFSTALNPPAAAAARAALEVLEREPERIERLHANVDRLREGLAEIGLAPKPGPTPILPIVVGDRDTAMQLSQALLDEGVFVPAIRPPSVPEGQSRLRVTAMATHTSEDIDEALEAFEQVAETVGVSA